MYSALFKEDSRIWLEETTRVVKVSEETLTIELKANGKVAVNEDVSFFITDSQLHKLNCDSNCCLN